MKVKQSIIIIIIISLTLNCFAQKTNKIDSYTGASPMYYDTLHIAKLIEIIKNSKEAHVLSTVNPNGTPNAAYMEPNVINEQTLLFYIPKEAQTRKNIDNNGYAFFSFYIRNEDGKTWKDRYKGGRMLLQKIMESEVSKTLKKEAKLNEEYENDALFFKIIKIIPFS